jgi:subtilisin family serine protease
MIDACSSLYSFAHITADRSNMLPRLCWVNEWRRPAGYGIVAGLLDTDFDQRLPDLVGANLVLRDFSDSAQRNTEISEHGTHSVTTLIGQGHQEIRGIAPKVKLLVAQVAGPDGIANPSAVMEGIAWLLSSGAQIVIIPLGDHHEHREIAEQIEQAAAHGVLFFAAAGNGYPAPLAFPARHPLAIAIGGADNDGYLLAECSRLPRLDLVAPGWKIAAPIHNGVMSQRSGTSVATIVAAGAAILVLSAITFPLDSSRRTTILSILSGEISLWSPRSGQDVQYRSAD